MRRSTVTRPSGGSTTGRSALTGQQLNLAIQAAHRVLLDCGVSIGTSRVARIVRRFAKAAARQGLTFHEFLSGEANLTAAQQRRMLANPDYARVIAYLDPTGETAVNNVMRSRRQS